MIFMHHIQTSKLFLITALTSLLMGCASASMRIQVDVYKGPLSNDIEVQKGQLATLLQSVPHIVNDMDGQLIDSMCRIGCVTETEQQLSQGGRLYPTYKVCSQRGIPQRRVRVVSHDDQYNERPYTPFTNLSGPPKSDAEDIVAYLGVQTKEGDPQDRIISNYRNNYISQGSRFPDIMGKNYRVCPIYERMRLQMEAIKCQYDENTKLQVCVQGINKTPRTVIRGPLLRNAFGFLDDTDMPKTLGEMRATIIDTLERQKEEICKPRRQTEPLQKGTLAGQPHQNLAECQMIINKIAKLKQIGELEEGIFPADAKRRDRIAMEAVLSSLEEILAALEPSIKKSGGAIGKAITPTDLPEKVAALAISTASASSQINELNSVSGDLTVLEAALSVLADTTAEPKKDASHLSVTQQAAASLQRNLEALSSPDTGLHKAADRLRTIRTRLAAKDDAALKGHLIGLGLIHPKLDAAAPKATQGSTTLKKAKIANDSLTARLNELENQRTQYQALKTEFDRLKTFTENDAGFLTVIEVGTPGSSEPNRSVALKIETRTKALQKIVDDAKQSSWGAASGLDAIDTKLQSILGAVNDFRAQTSVTAPDDGAGKTKPLSDVLTTFTSESLPTASLSLAAASDTASLRKRVLDTLADPVNTKRDKLAPSLAYFKAANGLTDVATGLSTAASTLQAAGIKPEDAARRKLLISVRADLKKQAEEIGQLRADLKNNLDLIDAAQTENEMKAYRQVAMIAGNFRVLATAIAIQQTSVNPEEQRLRIDMLKTANMAAELANQLTSRANALSQQARGIDRRRLPTAQYLRDTQPTDFIRTFDWLEASAGDREGLNVEERTLITERLFDDDNWARVNEAYASGAGDVTMAFIRDEIGNWNLKSFSSDPAELVQAYRQLGFEALDKAKELIADTSTAGATAAVRQAKALIDVADVAAGGTAGDKSVATGALIQRLNLDQYRSDLVKELEKQKENIDFDDNSDAQKALLDRCNEKAKADNADAEAITSHDNEKCKPIRDDMEKTARMRAEEIAKNYVSLIDALGRVVLESEKPEEEEKQ